MLSPCRRLVHVIELAAMHIDKVEVRVVAPKVPRYTWSHDLPEQYMTNTLVRVYTDSGTKASAV